MSTKKERTPKELEELDKQCLKAVDKLRKMLKKVDDDRKEAQETLENCDVLGEVGHIIEDLHKHKDEEELAGTMREVRQAEDMIQLPPKTDAATLMSHLDLLIPLVLGIHKRCDKKRGQKK